MNHFFLRVIVPASILIPVSLAIRARKTLKLPLWLVFYYLLLSGTVNVIATIMAVHRTNNLPLLHGYTIAEFCMIAFFYRLVLPQKKAAKIITVLLVVFPALCIVNTVFFESLYHFNSYARSLEAILIAGMSIAWLGRSATEEHASWGDNAVNWLSAGFLLYFSGSLFLFSFADILISDTNTAARILLWNIHGCLLIAMYLLIAKAYWVCRR